MEVAVCGWCKSIQCTVLRNCFNILHYCHLEHSVIVMFRKNTSLICSPSFCSIDPFLLLLKILPGKGILNSASLWIIFLTIPIQQVLHFLSTTRDDMWILSPHKKAITRIYSQIAKGSFDYSELYTSRSYLLNRYCLTKTTKPTNNITTCSICSPTCDFSLQCKRYTSMKTESTSFHVHKPVKFLFMVHDRQERPLRISTEYGFLKRTIFLKITITITRVKQHWFS